MVPPGGPGEWPGGISPPGSLRTRREGLPSPGSHRPTLGGRDEMPVSKEPGLAPTSSTQPGPCPHGPPPQTLELLHGPPNQVLVDAPCDEMQPGAVEEGGGEELPLPAPVKPDVSLSTHPAYYLGCSTKGSSLLPDWPSGPTRSGAFAPGPLQPLHHYYAPVRPSAPHPVLSPSVFDLGVLPFPPSLVGPRHDWFPSSVQEPTPRSCPLYAGHRLAKSEMTPPGLSQGRASTLVLMSSSTFRRVIGRFAFAQLRGAYLTGVPLPFPATLKTPALNGRPLQWFGIPLSQS